MRYKDYFAAIIYSEEDNLFVGRLAGIRHIVTFHGESVRELKNAFKEAVDDYLEFCEKEGLEPQRPYSGKLILRINPELHAQIAKKAELGHTTINKWISGALEKELQTA